MVSFEVARESRETTHSTPPGSKANFHFWAKRGTVNKLVVFFDGGGACWDPLTCLGPVPSSFYVTTGYDRVAFATDVLRPVMLLSTLVKKQNS